MSTGIFRDSSLHFINTIQETKQTKKLDFSRRNILCRIRLRWRVQPIKRARLTQKRFDLEIRNNLLATLKAATTCLPGWPRMVKKNLPSFFWKFSIAIRFRPIQNRRQFLQLHYSLLKFNFKMPIQFRESVSKAHFGECKPYLQISITYLSCQLIHRTKIDNVLQSATSRFF